MKDLYIDQTLKLDIYKQLFIYTKENILLIPMALWGIEIKKIKIRKNKKKR